MADFTWDDMPEDLAGLLYEATNINLKSVAMEKMETVLEWVESNIKTCTATSDQWVRIPHGCKELPVPGSEFCPLHMPAEEMGDDG